jgi:hypothetical protein
MLTGRAWRRSPQQCFPLTCIHHTTLRFFAYGSATESWRECWEMGVEAQHGGQEDLVSFVPIPPHGNKENDGLGVHPAKSQPGAAAFELPWRGNLTRLPFLSCSRSCHPISLRKCKHGISVAHLVHVGRKLSRVHQIRQWFPNLSQPLYSDTVEEKGSP